jgi:hypothetical protein
MIAENTVKPRVKDIVSCVLGDEPPKATEKVFLSNSAVS